MASGREVVVTIDSRLENVALVGVAVRAICGLLSFSEGAAYNMELCAVEAVSNSIRHAYRGEAGHAVEVRVSLLGDALEIRVLDRGRPVPEENRVPRSLDVDPTDLASLAEGGRGTFLIHTLMDRVEYGREKGANLLFMRKAYTSAS
jgi:serine/threonine-protein kinase RsbW